MPSSPGRLELLLVNFHWSTCSRSVLQGCWSLCSPCPMSVWLAPCTAIRHVDHIRPRRMLAPSQCGLPSYDTKSSLFVDDLCVYITQHRRQSTHPPTLISCYTSTDIVSSLITMYTPHLLQLALIIPAVYAYSGATPKRAYSVTAYYCDAEDHRCFSNLGLPCYDLYDNQVCILRLAFSRGIGG